MDILWALLKGIIYAVLNQKGGVGKSTLAFDLAAALAEDDQKNVLLIDLDPQGHATEGIGLKDLWVRDDLPTLYDALLRLSSIEPQALIHEVPGEKFFAIPSNFQMMELDKDLTGVRSRETRLLDLVTLLRGAFDVIVIDSPSYFGNLTDNLIRAVGIPVDGEQRPLLQREQGSGKLTPLAVSQLLSGLVVPIQAEQTSVRASELLFNQIRVVETELKIAVHQLAIVPNLVQKSDLAARILRDFRESLGEAMPPLEIPKRIVFQEAYELGRSIFTFQPKDTRKLPDVLEMRQRYLKLASFLYERGEMYARRFD